MGQKILIADDEAHIRLLLKRTLEDLEDEDVEIITANDGAQALDKISTERPNLVFLDVMMPIINGFDVCHAIKRQMGLQNIHIIMLTAKGQEFDKQKGKEVGADSYITKPFDPDQIYDEAIEVLGLEG